MKSADKKNLPLTQGSTEKWVKEMRKEFLCQEP